MHNTKYSMKLRLTVSALKKEAKKFCESNSGVYKSELFGITDGKAVGTYVEHLFQQHLADRYAMDMGNSATGLDLPTVNTDIKVTSIKQPQSSCPFKDSKQKIFGLGYNLLVFVYNKTDDITLGKSKLDFVSCSLIEANRTGDYQTTTGIRRIIENNGNADDIFAFLVEHNIPADEVTLYRLASDILNNPPAVGYLTISNALQWRLQYGRVVALTDDVAGITPIIKYIK